MDSSGDSMPLPDADKKSPRVYTLSQNTDLENMAFATMQSIGQPINIEELNEDELRRLVLVNLARLAVKGEWEGLLSTGGSSAVVFPPFSPPDGAAAEEAFIPTLPIIDSYGFTGTLSSDFDKPTHYPFYSGSYTEVEEYAIFFTGSAATASTTASLAIYTLSTADDTGWDIGRPMNKVANSEVSFAADTATRTEVSPASTVTLEANTWYSIAIVGDQSFATYPTVNRAFGWDIYWGNPNYGGLQAAGETDFTLPASYSDSDTWAASTVVFSIPKLFWRGTN